jgi:hypothetical protein
MKIRITKSFGGYRIGQVFDWGDGMARIYIARGMAELAVEAAAVEERTEKAAVTTQARKRVK